MKNDTFLIKSFEVVAILPNRSLLTDFLIVFGTRSNEGLLGRKVLENMIQTILG